MTQHQPELKLPGIDEPAPARKEIVASREFEGLDLRGALLILRRRLGVMAGVFVIGMTIAALAAFLLPKRYTAASELLINPPRESIVDMEGYDTGTTSQSGYIDSQVEIIRSRELLARVADKLRLKDDPEFNPRKNANGSWIDSLPLWSWGQPEGQSIALDNPREQARTREKTIDALLGQISVRRAGLSYLIRISATSRSPEKAEAIANGVTSLYLYDQLEWRVEAINQTGEWLRNRVDDLRAKLLASERAMEIYRAEHDLVDVSGQTMNDQQRSEINAQLILARANLGEKEARFGRVRQILEAGGSPEIVAEVLSSEVIVHLRQQQAELVRQQADLESHYGARHPKMVNIRAQIHDLDKQVENEVKRIVANLDSEVAVARQRMISLRQGLGELTQQAGVNEQAQVRLRDLERDVEANRQLYESLLEGYKKSGTLTGTDNLQPVARQISKAAMPVGPSFPRPTLFLAVGFFFSSLTAIGAAFLLEALDSGFRTGARLEERLGVAHIASIPSVPRAELKRADVQSLHDFLLAKPLSAFAEEHRKLRGSLALANVDRPPKVVLVTSSLPDEGKTTSAASLARVAAKTGLKTLLIDADLRHPSLNRLFNLKPRGGIVDILQKTVELRDAIVIDEPSGLHLLLSDGAPANSSDLLASQAMRGLIQSTRYSYDLVILDSAPVLPLVDSLILAKQTDAIVFFVRWEKTPRGAAEKAVQLLRDYGGNIAGAVFSFVDTRRSARQGYGDSNYYYGRYKGYYGE